jgi:hypothetical protein
MLPGLAVLWSGQRLVIFIFPNVWFGFEILPGLAVLWSGQRLVIFIFPNVWFGYEMLPDLVVLWTAHCCCSCFCISFLLEVVALS